MPSAEYIVFLHGLGWLVALMMAALVPGLPGVRGRRQAGWLVAFCATQILAVTAGLALPEAGILPVAATGADWHQMAALLSGMVLWEFACRFWNDQGRRRIPPATHLVAAECLALVVAVTALAGVAPNPPWFTPIAWAFALLPSLLGGASAVLLWRCFGRENDAPRRLALRVAAVGLGAFSAFGAVPGLSFGEVLPPWIVVTGLAVACLALPAVRTRPALAAAAGLVLAIGAGPPGVAAHLRLLAAAQQEDQFARAQIAAALLPAKDAARLGPAPATGLNPATRGVLRQYLEKLRAADPLLHSATLWTLRDGRVWTFAPAEDGAAGLADTRPATVGELEGVARDRPFLSPSAGEDGRKVVTVNTPLRAAPFETPPAWLAVEYPGEFWAVQQVHARRSGLTLVGGLAALCAMAFVLAARQAVENAQRLELERMQAAGQAKTEFLAFLGHELRTPLQTILGRAELLPAAGDPGVRRRAVAAIATQGRLMLRLVNDLLDLGTIEAGRLELQPRPLALPALLAAVEETAGAAAGRKGLACQVCLDPRVPEWVLADEARLLQVLGNLLGNAVKYTATGGVELLVEAAGEPPVPVPEAARVRFRVRDTGPGLPPEKIARLFTLFTRLDAGTTFSREGTGVGLALVRRLVELMGGTVRAANRTDGPGAEFTVELVFPIASPGSGADGPSAPDLPPGAQRVLVVEDHPATRELLVDFLHALGCAPVAVDDGAAARAALARGNFDAVLLDVNLPGVDGIALAREFAALRGAAVRPRLIGCSAEVLPGTRAAALAAGMDIFLAKPVALAELRAALATAGSAPDFFSQLQTTGAGAQARRLAADELPGAMAAVHAAVAANDWPAAQRAGHYLHNTALVLGDPALAGAARAVEHAAALGDAVTARQAAAGLARPL